MQSLQTQYIQLCQAIDRAYSAKFKADIKSIAYNAICEEIVKLKSELLALESKLNITREESHLYKISIG